MQQLLTGTIHGNTIVLDAPPGVPEGQHVEVIVRVASSSGPKGTDQTQDGSDETAFVFTEEDERILEEIYRARHFTTRREIEP